MTAPDPKKFTVQNDMVYVNFNYRLGALGFFAHPSLTETNFGLRDQIEALKWVQRNIKKFGGDPKAVTVVGSSAGAISACLLLTSPLAQGLFHRVVMQSSLCDYPFPNTTQAHENSNLLSAALNCNPSNISCLRSLPPQAILTALPLARGLIWTPGATWFPIIGDQVVPVPPNVANRDPTNKYHNRDIDIVMGYTTDEGSLFFFLAFPIWNPTNYIVQTVANAYKDHLMKFSTHYDLTVTPEGQFSLNADFGRSLNRIVSDLFACSVYRTATDFTELGHRVHIYNFHHHPSYIVWPLDKWLGVPHGAEMSFLFENSRYTFTEVELQFIKNMNKIWTWFVTHNEPFHSDNIIQEPNFQVSWPAWSKQENKTLRVAPRMGLVGRPAVCDLWDSVLQPDRSLQVLHPLAEPFSSYLVNVLLLKAFGWVIQNLTTAAIVLLFFAALLVAYIFRKKKRAAAKKPADDPKQKPKTKKVD